MRIEDCFELGKITKLHGLKGEVLAFFDVDDPEVYAEVKSIFLHIKNQLVPFFVEYIRVTNGGQVILKFEDINSQEQARGLLKTLLYLPSDLLEELEEDEFYYHELIGCRVIDENLGELGIVQTYYPQAMQDILGMEYQGKEVLIPIAEAIIHFIDLEQQIIQVKLPEGLLDLYLSDEP